METRNAISVMNITVLFFRCTGLKLFIVLTKYVAAEAGIDEFVANSKPQDKFRKVEEEKSLQRMVAMVLKARNGFIGRWPGAAKNSP